MVKTILVIFGISGDLAQKKLIPSISYLKQEYKDSFEVIGVGRKEISTKEFSNYIKQHTLHKCDSSYFSYQKLAYDKLEDYLTLKENLKKKSSTKTQYLFYLALPPQNFPQVIHNLKLAQLNKEQSKIILEKPFGHNLSSAESLQKKLLKAFKEKQIYRIDHYLGKEAIQNFLFLKFSNPLFKALFSNKYIDNIQISANEHYLVDTRASYYDESGALRDMIQNHLFQVLALLLMKKPKKIDAKHIRDEKYRVFKSLKKYHEKTWHEKIVFGQYQGYTSHQGVKNKSKTPTFVALELQSKLKEWKGVNLFLKTGKALKKKEAKVVIEFKKEEIQSLFNKDISKNRLIITIQPNEEIYFEFNSKIPSKEESQLVNANFKVKEHFEEKSPEAYEKLLLEVFESRQNLFTRYDELRESWKIVDKLLSCSKNCPQVYTYLKNSNGPKEAENLLNKKNTYWY